MIGYALAKQAAQTYRRLARIQRSLVSLGSFHAAIHFGFLRHLFRWLCVAIIFIC